MKKVFLFFLLCTSIAMNIHAQLPLGVSLDHNTIIMAKDSDTTLVATVIPSDAGNKNLTWEILHETGISVIDTINTTPDGRCIVQAKDVGTAKIVVHTVMGNKMDTCVFHVVIPVESISLSVDTVRMFLEHDTTLIATISPEKATNDSIVWSLSDNTVVSFLVMNDTVCYLKALSVGEAILYAKVYFGDTIYQDSCIIEVTAIPIESLTFDTNNITISVGTDTVLTVHLTPNTGIDSTILWWSSDENIVSRVSSGYETTFTIRGKSIGVAKVAATSYADPTKTDTVVVTVIGIPAIGIYLTPDTMEIAMNTNAQVIACVSPFNTTDKSIEWISNDSTTVDILSTPININDTICHISALKSGSATIFAKTIDGDFKDSCFVRVFVPMDSLVMNIDSITLDIDEKYQLKAIIYPDSATYKSLLWTVSDFALVDTLQTINDSICRIQATKAGIAIVYAMTLDGLYKDSCVITINPTSVTGITMNVDSVKVRWSEIERLIATIHPANASDMTVTWTSTDPTVVEIYATNNDTICDIKALQPGEVKIIAETLDGSFKDTCIVTVVPLATGIKLNDHTLTAYLDNGYIPYTYLLNAVVLPSQPYYFQAVEWTSSDSSVVDLSPMSMDTIHELIPKSVGVAIIYARALYGDFKDSCIVTVKNQYVVLESDTASINGLIEMSLILPDQPIQSVSFTLQLPKYFGLTWEGSKYRTKLSDESKSDYELSILKVNDSIYQFDIQSLTTQTSGLRLRSDNIFLKMMDIYYTIYEDALFGLKNNYFASLKDVLINLSDTIIDVDKVDIVIKSFKDPTGNTLIFNHVYLPYVYNNRLYVNSDKAETVSVYSLNGSLLFTGKKKSGQAIFNLHTREKFLIIKGSSGWANKVTNRD